MVSVICLTYNHVAYIQEALQSMVSQKTSFPYEIIVHDDASTDGTADIVRLYAELYPDKVKAILRQENQYRKGIIISDKLIAKNAAGKYIALCEGDDYWTDCYKLQKQVDYMEEHADCTLCFHNAVEQNMQTGVIKKVWRFDKKIYRGSGVYSSDETIRLKCVPTASMLFRKCNIPFQNCCSKKARIGDMIITIYLGTMGYSYCMEDTMSVYRIAVKDSATDVWKRSLENHNMRYLGTIETLQNIDAYTKGKYHIILEEMIREYQNKLLAFSENSVKKLIQNTERIYIYGIGIYANWCSNCLKKLGMEYEGYIVSDGNEKPVECCGKKVWYLSDLCQTENIGVIIGTSDKYKNEIIKNLEKSGIKYYCQGIEQQSKVD